MQNKIELHSVPLSGVSGKSELSPGDELFLALEVFIRKIDEKVPLIFYTRTKEKYRGEIATVKLPAGKNK